MNSAKSDSTIYLAKPRGTVGRKIHMNSESLKEKGPTLRAEAGESQSLDAIFDTHIAKEFVARDVDATMATMVAKPYAHCVPIMTGGSGGKGVRRFYSEHFVNQIPKDNEALYLIGRAVREATPPGGKPTFDALHIACCQERPVEQGLERLVRRVLRSTLEQLRRRQAHAIPGTTQILTSAKNRKERSPVTETRFSTSLNLAGRTKRRLRNRQ